MADYLTSCHSYLDLTRCQGSAFTRRHGSDHASGVPTLFLGTVALISRIIYLERGTATDPVYPASGSPDSLQRLSKGCTHVKIKTWGESGAT